MSDVKQRVKRKAGHRCEKCGREPGDTTTLEAHHIVPDSEGGETTEENLAALCNRCHEFAPEGDPVVGSYEEIFEVFCNTGMRPELDMMKFGLETAERFDLAPKVAGKWDSLLGYAAAMTTDVPDEDSDFTGPDSYWLFGASMAGEERVTQNIAPQISMLMEELEAEVAAIEESATK